MTPAQLRQLPRTSLSKKSQTSPEFVPPAYAFREMPPVSELPKDKIAREIVLLLRDHPDVASQFESLDLGTLPVEAKRAMLTEIKQRLDIKPIRTRRLGYVGP